MGGPFVLNAPPKIPEVKPKKYLHLTFKLIFVSKLKTEIATKRMINVPKEILIISIFTIINSQIAQHRAQFLVILRKQKIVHKHPHGDVTDV